MSERLHYVAAKSVNKDAQKQRAKISEGVCKRDFLATFAASQRIRDVQNLKMSNSFITCIQKTC